MTEILFSKNPFLSGLTTGCVRQYFEKFIDEATQFNIATGYITNDSIATLQQIVEYKKGKLNLNVFIGMNYLEGFTKVQYTAVKELSQLLLENKQGQLLLSPNALYHGKMYSFMKDGHCLGGFIGSSNLGSFVGRDPSYVEADALFLGNDGLIINDSISAIVDKLGVGFSDLPTLSKFKEPETKLLRDYHYVKELEKDDIDSIKNQLNGNCVEIELRPEKKSNLNAYFGAGKIKTKYSPRGWYEVELIIPKSSNANAILPKGIPFTVVTNDGYLFTCERQGDYHKNFRSCKDLKILGRWIKGQMENDGALEIGKPVTEETFSQFGRNKLLLQQTNLLDESNNPIWYISLV